MHIFEQTVGNIQAQTALRIGLQDVAELPADGVRRNAPLQTANPKRRQNAAQQAAENAADADVYFEYPQDLRLILLAQLKRHVIDANHLAALGVDDLLIQQIAREPQHVFVGVVRGEVFIPQMNAIQRNGLDLIVTDGQQRAVAADQKAVDANRIHQRHDCGVLDRTEAPPLKVVDLEAE